MKLTREKIKFGLLSGLNNTKAEIVHIDVTQVASVIGIDQTEELCIHLTESEELIKIAGVSKLKNKLTGIGTFNREELLEAFAKAKDDSSEV